MSVKKWEFYFVLFIGFIIFFFGMVTLAIYFAILYLSPLISNLTGISFVSSRFLVLAFLSIIGSGVFLSFYPISKALDGNSSFHIFIAFVFSGLSLGIQLYKLAVLGPTWMGVEILGTSGNTNEMMYLSAAYFVFTLIIFALEFTILKQEVSGGKESSNEKSTRRHS